MRVRGDAIGVVSRQRGISLLAEDRDSYGSNCEPNATAPRSARLGTRYRGSRTCSLRSPARDPRLLYRPLRGRGLAGAPPNRSAVADSLAHHPTAPRSRTRWRTTQRLRGRGLAGARPNGSAVADSLAHDPTAPRSRTRWRTTQPLRGRGLAGARPNHSAVADSLAHDPTAATENGRALVPALRPFHSREGETPQACGELLHRPLLGRGPPCLSRGQSSRAPAHKHRSPRRKPWDCDGKASRAPEGRKKNANARRPWPCFAPCGASIDFCLLTHGLRRGLRCLRTCGAPEECDGDSFVRDCDSRNTERFRNSRGSHAASATCRCATRGIARPNAPTAVAPIFDRNQLPPCPSRE